MTVIPFGSVQIPDAEKCWLNAIHWASGFDHFMVFDHHDITYPGGGFPRMIMTGKKRRINLEAGSTFSNLKEDRRNNPGWLCGYLGYDLKNETEKLSSDLPDFTEFPGAIFFEPEHVLRWTANGLEIHSDKSREELIRTIQNTPERSSLTPSTGRLVQVPHRRSYIDRVNRIRQHIIDGDMYEMNYCIHTGLEAVEINPMVLYKALMERSPTPFSVFGRYEDHYLICASPERFLRKTGKQLLSQPIKGTVRRGKYQEEDAGLIEALRNSEKERAENMMIVDLVRNDLAKSARIGSVHVPELFGIYSFQHLHQMISSVTAELRPEVDSVDAIRNAFPMGSMTGAPKIKVMELIEQYETNKRNVYSGAAGFFTPDNDFDFNVIIRSMTYNARLKRLGFWVGSAITYDSDPEHEYDECLLKARAIMEVLEHTGILDTAAFFEKS